MPLLFPGTSKQKVDWFNLQDSRTVRLWYRRSCFAIFSHRKITSKVYLFAFSGKRFDVADEVTSGNHLFFCSCSPLFGNCPFFLLRLRASVFSVFLSVSPPLFLSAGFFLLPLQITDIFLCLFFDAPLGGGIKLPVFFFTFWRSWCVRFRLWGSRCHYYFGRLCHFFCFPCVSLSLLLKRGFLAWFSFRKTV